MSKHYKIIHQRRNGLINMSLLKSLRYQTVGMDLNVKHSSTVARNASLPNDEQQVDILLFSRGSHSVFWPFGYPCHQNFILWKGRSGNSYRNSNVYANQKTRKGLTRTSLLKFDIIQRTHLTRTLYDFWRHSLRGDYAWGTDSPDFQYVNPR